MIFMKKTKEEVVIETGHSICKICNCIFFQCAWSRKLENKLVKCRTALKLLSGQILTIMYYMHLCIEMQIHYI